MHDITLQPGTTNLVNLTVLEEKMRILYQSREDGCWMVESGI